MVLHKQIKLKEKHRRVGRKKRRKRMTKPEKGNCGIRNLKRKKGSDEGIKWRHTLEE